MSELVTLAVADGVATITLARPEANNAMSWDWIADLGRAVDGAVADASVRAVLILSLGKNFCVGGDIRAFAGSEAPDVFIRQLAEALHVSVLKLAELPVPVIAAVQGAAAGAGLSLVAGADIVLAGRSSNYTMAYAGIGLTADGGGTWFLPRVIGLRRTQELAYSGRRLSAEDAERYGLVTRIVDDATLEDEARALAVKIAAGPTAAYGAVKRLLTSADTAPLAEQLDAEAIQIGRAMATADARGAVAAFLDRRAATFEGR